VDDLECTKIYRSYKLYEHCITLTAV